MKKSGTGGNKTTSGLKFERKLKIEHLFDNIPGYTTRRESNKSGISIFFHEKLVARMFIKNEFYKFLEENNIAWRSIISKKLIPDSALYVIIRDTLCIFEIKYQEVPGSVDEKLQTCDFKRKQFLKLVEPLDLWVEYVYILNDWFKKPEYKDVLYYIRMMNCHYVFNEVPLSWLGLPHET